jgi:hypothetical protein
MNYVVSETKWIRLMNYYPAQQGARFLELRITNYEEL